MKNLYLVCNDNIVKRFTFEEHEKLNDITNQFILNSKMKWGYEIIRRNLDALFQNTNNQFRNIQQKPNWEELEKITLEMNRNVLNYLSSINAFIDHSQKFFSTKYGQKSDEFEKLDVKKSELYDKYFEYRFLYNLRNYTLHCGFSVCAISIVSENNQIKYIPKFIYEDLINFKWQKKVKEDLKNIGKDFRAFDIFSKGLSIYEELYNFIFTDFIEKEEVLLKNQYMKILDIDMKNISDYEFWLEEEDNCPKIKKMEIPKHYLNV